MLKRFHDFLDTARYWQIYLFFLVVFTAVFFVFGSIFTHNFNKQSILQISFGMSIVVAAFGTASAHVDRKNHRFWHMANELETRIGEATDEDILFDLYNEEYQELKTTAFSKAQNSEVKRLYVVIITKFAHTKVRA
jgi:hypothetical protein